MQWQHKGFSFKINQFIYSSGHTNVEQAQCLIFLSALCCIWLLLNTETTNHRNVKEFVTEISAGRISTVSDYIHAAWMFSCCVCVFFFFFSSGWFLLQAASGDGDTAVLSRENTSSSSAWQASSLGRAIRPGVCMVDWPSTHRAWTGFDQACLLFLAQRHSCSEVGWRDPVRAAAGQWWGTAAGKKRLD